MLSDTVSYLKISSLKVADVRGYVRAAESGKGLIVDLRGAPSEPVWGEVLQLARPRFFARITVGDLSNPGAFEWEEKAPRLDTYAEGSGIKIVVLMDELTQSNVEYDPWRFGSPREFCSSAAPPLSPTGMLPRLVSRGISGCNSLAAEFSIQAVAPPSALA
jgi:hypothetical protein